MFAKTLIVSSAFLASRVMADAVGAAIVKSLCDYEVYIYNTPASDGGYTAIDTTLSEGETYEQTWTELSNGDGWSIKLSTSTALENIMQYEYTFQDDGTIWYDLSDVNGNPWNGNWEITATSASGTCDPRQAAYRYSTDDAYGMQACPQDSYITVTLCSGDSAASSLASSVAAAASTAAASSASAVESSSTTEAASSTTEAASSTTEAPSSSTSKTHSWNGAKDKVEAATTSATTLATSTKTEANGVTITEVETAIVTDVVYATAYDKRNEAVHRHMHNHRRHN